MPVVVLPSVRTCPPAWDPDRKRPNETQDRPEDGHETMPCRLLPLPFSVRCVYDIRCIENRVIGNGWQPSCFRPGIPFPMDFRQKAVRS